MCCNKVACNFLYLGYYTKVLSIYKNYVIQCYTYFMNLMIKSMAKKISMVSIAIN